MEKEATDANGQLRNIESDITTKGRKQQEKMMMTKQQCQQQFSRQNEIYEKSCGINDTTVGENAKKVMEKFQLQKKKAVQIAEESRNTLLIANAKKNEIMSLVGGHKEQVEKDDRRKDRDCKQRLQRRETARQTILDLKN